MHACWESKDGPSTRYLNHFAIGKGFKSLNPGFSTKDSVSSLVENHSFLLAKCFLGQESTKHLTWGLDDNKYFQTNTEPTNKKRWKNKENHNHQLPHGPGILQLTLWVSWPVSRNATQLTMMKGDTAPPVTLGRVLHWALCMFADFPLHPRYL